MTIKEFVKTLKKHHIDFDKDIAICFDDESDGEDFKIEEDNFCLFLIRDDWGEEPKHKFLDHKED